jgi:penicillin-binding protein 1A
VRDLTLAEAALIAGCRVRRRSTTPSRVSSARSIVALTYCDACWKLGKIDQASHDAALERTISARRHGPIIEVNAPYVAEMTRVEMVRRFGPAH